jgi:Malectin-like domain
VSIDCGLSGTSSYVDDSNNLAYYSDDKYTDTGINYENPSLYETSYRREYHTVRAFPNGTRNCYTIRSLTTGSNYLIRALFYYANYDNKNNPPTFDIYLGVDFWTTVNADSFSYPEIIVSATSDYLDVCLVNTNQGVPFITSLHLRKFDMGMYAYVNSTTSLILVERDNMGESSSLLRLVCKDI